MVSQPLGIRLWSFARASADDELEWSRVGDFLEMELPRPLVLVNGAFDMLHVGHMRLLAAARTQAGPDGTVVCALDSDLKIARRKGPGKPILSWVERATALHYMPINHLVEISTDRQFLELVQTLEPDCRVLGSEYAGTKGRIPDVPSVLVRDSGLHTTDYLARIVNAENLKSLAESRQRCF